jgi:hypothetical protein
VALRLYVIDWPLILLEMDVTTFCATVLSVTAPELVPLAALVASVIFSVTPAGIGELRCAVIA